MDIRSLRYFVETVRLNSFTQAAETMNVTQSTISKMVRQLEEQTGSRLITKDGRRLTLTDTGKVVFGRGEQILALMQQLEQEVRDTKTLQFGRLEIGIPPMVNTLFTPVLKRFREQHGKITLALHEDTGRGIEQKVADGVLEIGLTVLPVAPSLGLLTRPVVSHPVWAVGAQGSFAAKLKTLPLRALRDVPLVMLNDDFALTRRLRQAFDDAGFTPQLAAQCSQWDWVVSMASMGIGVALLPEPFVQRLQSPPLQPLQAVRIDAPGLSWDVAHIFKAGDLSGAARAWLAVCAAVLGQHQN